jgi:hypothetical protein
MYVFVDSIELFRCLIKCITKGVTEVAILKGRCSNEAMGSDYLVPTGLSSLSLVTKVTKVFFWMQISNRDEAALICIQCMGEGGFVFLS